MDKWLWYARFFKTRTLAAKIVASGAVRVDGNRIKKGSVTVSPGDTLTFIQNRDVRVVRIKALGERRGPAPEAQELYEDLAPVEKPDPSEKARQHTQERVGRPTKKQRRELTAIKRSGS